MGLLTTGGPPMQWGTDANNRAVPHVSAHGIQQFLHSYKANKDLDNFPFLWGEELEHQLVFVGEDGVLLSPEAAETMERLSARPDNDAVWHPEYGAYMVESTPSAPYNLSVESLCSVQGNMQKRYDLIDMEAGPHTVGTTFVSFPLMGVGHFLKSDSTESPYSQSLFVPDACINKAHPRFANLTRNIRLRRGRKVCIQVPLFIDKHTLQRTVDPRLNIDANPQNVNIDCGVSPDAPKKRTTRFGGGAAAAPQEEAPRADAHENGNAKTANVKEKAERPPYSPIDPRELDYPASEALTHLYTPATLYYYGQYFTAQQRENVKKRYDACPCPVPSVSHPCIYMDCMAFGMGNHCLQVTMQLQNERQARNVYDQLAILCPAFLALSSATPFQKGLLCDSDVRWLTIAASVDDRRREEVPRILKSRYDSISTFISPDQKNLDEFNDEQLEINQPFYDVLRNAGVDQRLAKHIAHLFIRDPLVMYEGMIDIDDTTHMEHFENIQSTNWQTVRFKPPPYGSDIGWRVEFRVMDILPTPFENAAFSVVIPLLTSAIVKYKPCFYTKMSVVDENMGRAHRINPCSERYVMRKDIFSSSATSGEEETAKLTVNEIFNGSPGGYYGLIPLVRRYLKEEGKESPQLDVYLNFLSMRASGAIPTAAQYLRKFVLTHPDYKQDSRLTPPLARDLVLHVHALAAGTITDDSYLPMEAFKTGGDISRAAAKRPREEEDAVPAAAS